MVTHNTLTEPQAPRTVVPTAAEARKDRLVQALQLITEAAALVAAAVGDDSPITATVRRAYDVVKTAYTQAAPATKPEQPKVQAPATQTPTSASPAQADKTAGLAEYRRLKAECKAAGLSTNGGKEQLAGRLAAYKAKPATQPLKAEPPAPTVTLTVDAAKADLLRQLAALSIEQLQELARFIPAL